MLRLRDLPQFDGREPLPLNHRRKSLLLHLGSPRLVSNDNLCQDIGSDCDSFRRFRKELPRNLVHLKGFK
jgi:hypothetical protein